MKKLGKRYKDWFSHEIGLDFIHGDVFKDRSRNSATFKMELFEAIGNGRVYNQWTFVSAYCCSNLTIFSGKIKLDENGHALTGSYPERISYWLTGMGALKNVPKKQKFELLGLTSLFVKRKFNETHKDFSINYPYNSKCGKTIFSFNFSFD